MKAFYLWSGIFFILMVFGFINVKACSCSGGATPCFFYRGSGLAFIGTVTGVAEANEKYGKKIGGKARKITIRAEEIFKGNVPTEIVTSDDGFSCDNFPFTLGGTYLIYSDGVLENTGNILPVELCGGTRPIDDAADEVKFWRQLKNGIMPSVVYGKFLRVVNGEGNKSEPLAKTKVVLNKIYVSRDGQSEEPKKNDRRFETVTDENGEFRFENLGPGTYKFSAALPGDLWMPESREISAGGSPQCDSHTLVAFTNGGLSGNVTTADGTPARASVLISPADGATWLHLDRVWTDEKGNFTFSGLNEGKYRVSVSLAEYRLSSGSFPFRDFPYGALFYPHTFEYQDAELISLGYAQKLSNIDLKLPPPPNRLTVRGVIAWEDGSPAGKSALLLKVKKAGGDTQRSISVNEDGSFSFEIFEGFRYEVAAYHNSAEKNGYAEPLLLDGAKSSDNPLKLILKPRE